MFVLGTAGHVDHGKSTLLRALTGMEPDRLPEEKKRGMTIDLNFVWIELPQVGTVGIVDVPGHQKFVSNMVSGISGIDGFIFVVAADDGWMPQSEEHFELLKGMNVKKGIVVVTKCDLAPEHAAEVVATAKDKFKEFEKVEVVEFAAGDERKNKAVLKALENLTAHLPRPNEQGLARLWVDRVFTPKGQGTVVTGTLREGVLSAGQEIYFYPSRTKAVARSLQSHENEVTRAIPNRRLAIQLGAGNVKAIKRGELVSRNPDEALSEVLDVSLAPFFDFSPKRSVKMGFHLGTMSVGCKFTLLSKQSPRLFGRVQLDKPVPVRNFDRFVLRTSGEERSVGCGVIVDIRADKVKLSVAKEGLSEKALTPSGALKYLLSSHRVLKKADVAGITGADDFLKAAGLQLPQGELLDRKLWEDALQVLKESGEISEKDLVTKLKVSKPVALKLFAALEAEKLVEREGGRLKAVGAGPGSEEEQRAVEQWLPGFTPIPLTAQLKDPKTKSLMQKLILDKKIVRLAEDHFLSAKAYENHRKSVEAFIRQKGEGTTSDLKTLLGCSRKLAVMVLERLDSDRVTYLKDGVRKLLRD